VTGGRARALPRSLSIRIPVAPASVGRVPITPRGSGPFFVISHLALLLSCLVRSELAQRVVSALPNPACNL